MDLQQEGRSKRKGRKPFAIFAMMSCPPILINFRRPDFSRPGPAQCTPKPGQYWHVACTRLNCQEEP